jgi:hypothetical protein
MRHRTVRKEILDQLNAMFLEKIEVLKHCHPFGHTLDVLRQVEDLFEEYKKQLHTYTKETNE